MVRPRHPSSGGSAMRQGSSNRSKRFNPVRPARLFTATRNFRSVIPSPPSYAHNTTAPCRTARRSASSDSFAAFLPPPRSSSVLQHPSGVHQHRRRELAWRRAATTCGGIISSPSSSSESSARCAAPILHAPCRRGLPRHTGTLTGQDCLGVRTVPALCHRPHGHGQPSAARRRAALGEEGRLVLP